MYLHTKGFELTARGYFEVSLLLLLYFSSSWFQGFVWQMLTYNAIYLEVNLRVNANNVEGWQSPKYANVCFLIPHNYNSKVNNKTKCQTKWVCTWRKLTFNIMYLDCVLRIKVNNAEGRQLSNSANIRSLIFQLTINLMTWVISVSTLCQTKPSFFLAKFSSFPFSQHISSLNLLTE